MICCFGGSKSRRAKAAGAEPAGQKIAHRCGEKHISKSKVLKTDGFRALLDVEMSKKCTPLWREAHVQVKMYKARQHRSTFASWAVQKSTPLWREADLEVKMLKTPHEVWTMFGCCSLVFGGRLKNSAGFQQRWHAWSTWRGSTKMHFAWKAQYKQHVHQRCE